MHTIGNAFRHDSVARIREALTAEASPFAKQTLRKLDEKSPAALAITLRMLREGAEKASVIESLAMEHAVQCRLWKDESSDLHYGLENVVFGKGKRKEIVWPSTSTLTDAYVEKMFQAPSADEEILSLPELAPRPPTEARQLFEYYGNIAALEDSRPPPGVFLIETRLPDEESAARVGAEELQSIFEKSAQKIIPKKTFWHVAEAVEGEEPVQTVRRTEGSGNQYYAQDTKTGEMVQLPEQVKRQMLDEHPNAASLRVFRTELYDVHSEFDYDDPLDVAAMRDAIDEGAIVAKAEEGLEKGDTDVKLPYGLGETDGLVSSEGLSQVFARPFQSIDEEIEAMLKLMGHVEKKPEDTNTDELPNYHDEHPVMDKRPLTKREEKL